MPKDSLNIYLTAVDGVSPVLASITDKTKALDKETQQLQQTTNSFTKANQSLLEKQTKLQSEYDSSRKHLKDCQKAYDEYQDEISKMNLDNAIEQHAKLKNELAGVTEQLNTNKRAYKENVEVIRKGGLGQEGENSLSGTRMAMGLISGQVGQMMSSSVGGLAKYLAESALGVPTAELLSGGISDAISGIMAGSVFGIPGAIAGGVIGAGTGLLSGGIKILEAEDDAFKDYYGGLYEDVSERSDTAVESGSTIAAGREKDKISFTTLFKSENTAEKYLKDLVEMANTTPFLYDDLTAMSKTLATYGYDAKSILPQLQVIGDTGAALGMGTSDMTAVATALGRMKSSDKATLEYLNILNDRGIGAVGMLADAKGVSVGDMYGMISKGDISGTEAVSIITAALKEAYSGSMLTQSRTYEGLTSTREGLEQELENAAGEGYNTLRKEGLQAEVDALGGDLGDEMKEINTIIGENRARKENLQGEYERQAMGAVLSGEKGDLWDKFDEDSQAKLDEMHNELLDWKAKLEEAETKGDEEGAALASANIEALYEEAQATGQALFDNSEFMKVLNDTELDEAGAIRENTAGLENATQATRRLTEELSKGRIATVHGQTELEPYKAGMSVASYMLSGDTEGAAAALTQATAGGTRQAKSHAFGLRQVPYDDYPALLHRGERVLTASEARAAESEGLGTPPPPNSLGRRARAGELSAPPLSNREAAAYPPLREAPGGPRSGDSAGEYTDTAQGRRDAQAPAEGGGGGIQLTVTGNTFVGADEDMADQLFGTIVEKLERAYTAAGR